MFNWSDIPFSSKSFQSCNFAKKIGASFDSWDFYNFQLLLSPIFLIWLSREPEPDFSKPANGTWYIFINSETKGVQTFALSCTWSLIYPLYSVHINKLKPTESTNSISVPETQQWKQNKTHRLELKCCYCRNNSFSGENK